MHGALAESLAGIVAVLEFSGGCPDPMAEISTSKAGRGGGVRSAGKPVNLIMPTDFCFPEF